MLKLNDSDNYEFLCNVTLTKEKFPICFENKVQELLEENLFDSREEAEKAVEKMSIELELYYHKGYGLFAVECEGVESGTIYSPYSGELYTD